MKFRETLEELRSISQDLKNKGITVEKLDDAIRALTKHHDNIEKIESNIDAIKIEVIAPIKEELRQNKTAGKFSVFGFWVGAIGLIVSIGTVLFGPSIKDQGPTYMKNTSFPAKDNCEVSERLYQIETQLLFPKDLSLDKGDIFVESSSRIEIAYSEHEKYFLEVDSTSDWPENEGIKGGIKIYKDNVLIGTRALEGRVSRSDGKSELRPWFDKEVLAVDSGDKILLGNIEIEVLRILNREPKGRLLGDENGGISFRISETGSITSQSTQAQQSCAGVLGAR